MKRVAAKHWPPRFRGALARAPNAPTRAAPAGRERAHAARAQVRAHHLPHRPLGAPRAHPPLRVLPMRSRRTPTTPRNAPTRPRQSQLLSLQPNVAGRRQVGCLFYFIGRLLALDSTTWVSAFDGPPGQALRREGAPAPPPPLECKA